MASPEGRHGTEMATNMRRHSAFPPPPFSQFSWNHKPGACLKFSTGLIFISEFSRNQNRQNLKARAAYLPSSKYHVALAVQKGRAGQPSETKKWALLEMHIRELYYHLASKVTTY